jgi:hypothetical protein
VPGAERSPPSVARSVTDSPGYGCRMNGTGSLGLATSFRRRTVAFAYPHLKAWCDKRAAHEAEQARMAVAPNQPAVPASPYPDLPARGPGALTVVLDPPLVVPEYQDAAKAVENIASFTGERRQPGGWVHLGPGPRPLQPGCHQCRRRNRSVAGIPHRDALDTRRPFAHALGGALLVSRVRARCHHRTGYPPRSHSGYRPKPSQSGQ